MDIRNKTKLEGVHTICCGLHRYAIYLYSGKTAVFYMHTLLLYEVGTEKRQSLNLSRHIPIYICYLCKTKHPHFIMLIFSNVCELDEWKFIIRRPPTDLYVATVLISSVCISEQTR